MIRLAFALCAVAALASTAAAQSGRASVSGRLANTLDSSAVRGASIRLVPVDSTRMSQRMDVDAAEIFVDSANVRFAVSDSLGRFVVHELSVRRYLFQIRRIGFQPREGILHADSVTDIQVAMEPTSKLLAGVTITETSLDRNGKYLRDVGFSLRQRGGLGGHFFSAADVTKHRWHSMEDLLLWENIKYATPTPEVRIDGWPVQFDEAMAFPANLVMAVEVYPRVRPIEFEIGPRGTRRPLVLIWTFKS